VKSKATNRETGSQGEQIAETYLLDSGYRIADRNVRSVYGEIDFVAFQGDTLVFIEVKARRSSRFGLPEEAVDRRKQAKLIRLAAWYRSERFRFSGPIRFDVLAIMLKGDIPTVRLIENAIEL